MALTSLADFDGTPVDPAQAAEIEMPIDKSYSAYKTENSDLTSEHSSRGTGLGLNLGYTINLNLPATSDPAVFNAIFKSLKEHLLRDEDV